MKTISNSPVQQPIFPFIITIDGNINTEKTLLAKHLAEKLNFTYLNFTGLSQCLTLYLVISFNFEFIEVKEKKRFFTELELINIQNIRKEYITFQLTNVNKYKPVFKKEACENVTLLFREINSILREFQKKKGDEILVISDKNGWFINNFDVTEYVDSPFIALVNTWFLGHKIFKKLLEFFESNLIDTIDCCPFGTQKCNNSNILHFRMQGIVSDGYEMALHSLKSAYFKIYLRGKVKGTVESDNSIAHNIAENYDIYSDLYESLEQKLLKVTSIEIVEALSFSDTFFEDILIKINKKMKELKYI
ncbi:Cytidylate kinase [Cucumispora dikerogammari]|nr:Cytidylate kinase [Cucumispora dikerogammari]